MSISAVSRTCAILGLGFLLTAAARLEAQNSTHQVASGLGEPIFLNSPPGDSDRLFVAERGSGGSARIVVLDRDTGSQLGTYLTISGLVTSFESGLLGMAFDPDFDSNGYFYVYVSVPGGPQNHISEIRRYTASGNPQTSNIADGGSDKLILSFNQPAGNHNAGWVAFNPVVHPSDQQYLYIASGDGGVSSNAQNESNLLGNILRIDPSRDPNTGGYTVPSGNPFVGTAGADEIWSYGLRNPYRASFDRLTGDLWIGDVGQNSFEEIDFEPANRTSVVNYGWRTMEGHSCFNPSGGPPCFDPSLTGPVYDYPHIDEDEPNPELQGNSVTGGYVYRGSVPALQGHYIFADFISDNIWKIDPDAFDVEASVQRINDDLVPNDGSVENIASFGEDDAGELYLLKFYGGQVFRVVTASQDIEWNGDDNGAGTPGNGTGWSDASNWTRDGTADQAFVAEDNVIFQPGSSQSQIDLQSNRTAAAITFQADYTLNNNTLTVLSGNITVEDGVTATIQSSLSAETIHHSIRKLGDGTLRIDGTAGQTVVKEGTLGGTGAVVHLTVQEGGTVAPGASTGVLTVLNSYTQDGTIAVPEPAACWLLGAGVWVLWSRSIRRRV